MTERVSRKRARRFWNQTALEIIMSKNPRLFKNPIRLIVNVEADTVQQIDELMKQRIHHQHRNRAEFVRQAIENELARCDQFDD